MEKNQMRENKILKGGFVAPFNFHQIMKISSNWFKNEKGVLVPIFFLASCIACIFFILLYIHDQTLNSDRNKLDSRQNKIVNARLNDIQDALQKMSVSISNSPGMETSLHQLTADVAGMEKGMSTVAKSVDIKELSTQLTAIKDEVEGLQKNMLTNFGAKEYADPKILPFQAKTIDVISEQPFVTVQYDNHFLPLGIGDSLATWQVVSIDYQTATAEFTNDKGQLVKLTLTGQ